GRGTAPRARVVVVGVWRRTRSGGNEFCRVGRQGRVNRLGRGVVEQVQRAGQPGDASAGDVSVNHGRFQAVVAEKLLYRADVDATLHQMRGETVAKGVAMDEFVQAGSGGGPRHGPLDGRLKY